MRLTMCLAFLLETASVKGLLLAKTWPVLVQWGLPLA